MAFSVSFPLMAFFLSGCSLVHVDPGPTSQGSVLSLPNHNPAMAGSHGAGEPEQTANRLVEVYFATDRAQNPEIGQKPIFLGERNLSGGPISYGKCVVSIPQNHEPGVLETKKWWKFEFKEDPEKHVVIKSAALLDSDSFFDNLEAVAEDADRERRAGKQALLFIHGFNVSFDLAIRRTGQLAWDLDFPGVPMSFTWPSAGKLTQYTADESSAEFAKPHLAQVLVEIQKNTDIEKIHIIAHSMGTRVLTGALVMAKDQGFDLDLNNIVLAAADIGVDEFKEEIMPKIYGSSKRLTLFANSGDRALQASSRINRTPRLGRSGDNIVVLPGMDTIDATRVDRSFVGHSYFGGNSLMLRDLINLIVHEESPAQRRLTLQPNGAWTFFR